MRYFFSILITVSLWFCHSGCNDFLDVVPTTDITIPSSANDYYDMLYPLSGAYSADAMIGTLGDDVYWSNNFYLNQSTDDYVRRAYLYKDEVFDITVIPSAWKEPYTLIYTYNKIIEEVRHLSGEPIGRLLSIEAEARLYRALQYFHLGMMFTTPYALSTETTPGVPVIDKNDVNNGAREQSTVHALYRHILSDIDTAIKYLPPYPTLPARFIASQVGAYGLQARVYFNMGQYDNALGSLQHLFDILEAETPTVDLSYGLLDYNQLALKVENEPWQGMSTTQGFPRYSSDEQRNVESVMTSMLNLRDPTIGSVSTLAPFNAIFVSPHVLQLFTDAHDLRPKFMLHERDASGNYWDADAPGLKLKRFNYSNAGVSMPDVYLMAAECYARANDAEKALEYLNELRSKRIAQAGFVRLVSQDATQVLKWVLEERMREFIATGYRWYDMRRLWNDPVGSALINKARELNGETYPLTQERLTIRIPEYIMQYHPDWQQNP